MSHELPASARRHPSVSRRACEGAVLALSAWLGACAVSEPPDAPALLGSTRQAVLADHTLQCVAGYAQRGECDGVHWSELYEVCGLREATAFDHDALIAKVKAGVCTWENWPALYEALSTGTAQPDPDEIGSLDDALNCVAGYIHRGECDWAHWSELYDRCQTYEYATLDDDTLLDVVKAGRCNFESWPALFAHAKSEAPVVREPPAQTPTLEHALGCVEGYVQRDACDWTHWSEMYEACQTYAFPALDDGYLLDRVKEGGCTRTTWPALYAHLTDSILLDDVAHFPITVLPGAGDELGTTVEVPPLATGSSEEEDALYCIAGYAFRGECDLAHFDELASACRVAAVPMLADGALYQEVAAGACTWEHWKVAYVTLRGVRKPPAGAEVTYEERRPPVSEARLVQDRGAVRQRFDAYVVGAGGLPASDDALGRALGIPAGEVSARFGLLRDTIRNVRAHAPDVRALDLDQNRLLADLTERAAAAPETLDALLPLIETRAGSPGAEAREAEYRARLTALATDVSRVRAGVDGAEQRMTQVAVSMTADRATLERRQGEPCAGATGENPRAAALQGTIEALLAQREQARADYQYNLEVAASAAAYAWIWPFGTIAAASVVGVHAPRAEEARKLMESLDARIQALRDERTGVLSHPAECSAALGMVQSTVVLVAALAPSLDPMRGDLQRLRQDLDQLSRLLDDLARPSVIIRRRLREQALGLWQRLGTSASDLTF